MERLESQNSVLKEKSSDIRSENDRLVAKIQKLQSRISQEVGEILTQVFSVHLVSDSSVCL